jgi:two-component system, OmpR family, sensor histidine kinase CiaH
MLRQLRRKFIWINMALVALVLLAVTAVQVFAVWRQAGAETDAALRRALLWETGADRWQIGGRGDQPMVPTFCVVLDMSGDIRMTMDNYVEISTDTLTAAVSAALNGEDDTGRIPSLGLRYLRMFTGVNIRLAFADTSWQRGQVRQQAVSSLLIMVAALAIFFLISLFLSRWALRPVERSWKQQQQFVADASHELKTPLTVLLADADILLAHPDDTIASQRKWVEYMQDEAGRMRELVEDMLFLARSDSASEREQVRQSVSLSDLCFNCLLSFEPVAFERGAQLNDAVEPDVTVLGDESQLRRLIAILLDNACKYCGEQGTVTLTLRLEGGRAVLSVRNTGDPIPPEALPHLFERFYRADSARARDTGGYGLGLAIAAAIAEGHKGKISAASTAAEGTTFTVTLPTEHN